MWRLPRLSLQLLRLYTAVELTLPTIKTTPLDAEPTTSVPGAAESTAATSTNVNQQL
jgi:hypothetical protein